MDIRTSLKKQDKSGSHTVSPVAFKCPMLRSLVSLAQRPAQIEQEWVTSKQMLTCLICPLGTSRLVSLPPMHRGTESPRGPSRRSWQGPGSYSFLTRGSRAAGLLVFTSAAHTHTAPQEGLPDGAHGSGSGERLVLEPRPPGQKPG